MNSDRVRSSSQRRVSCRSRGRGSSGPDRSSRRRRRTSSSSAARGGRGLRSAGRGRPRLAFSAPAASAPRPSRRAAGGARRRLARFRGSRASRGSRTSRAGLCGRLVSAHGPLPAALRSARGCRFRGGGSRRAPISAILVPISFWILSIASASSRVDQGDGDAGRAGAAGAADAVDIIVRMPGHVVS